MKPLLFVTSNKKKADEAQAILPFPIKIHELDLEEIQSLDVEKIATHKAQTAFNMLQTTLFVDDVSLQIHAWDNFPGPLIKFMLANGNQLLLRLLTHEKDRSATLIAVVAYHDGEKVHSFIGSVQGTIALTSFGANGWGFDPIFIPIGTSKTYAEMANKEKNTLSHRYKVLVKFKEFLKTNPPA